VDLSAPPYSSALKQPPYLCKDCDISFAIVPHTDLCPRCGQPCEPQPLSIGQRKANICRANFCGQYDAGQDRCLAVVRIAASKGRSKPGHINYLLLAEGTLCPLGFHNSIE